MADRALRGSGLGSKSFEEDHGIEYAARQEIEFDCPKGHHFSMMFAAEAERAAIRQWQEIRVRPLHYPQAVLQVVNGGASITPNLARRLLQRFDKTHVDQPTRHESVEVDRLSDREKEVLRMVASGYTSAEIATNLLISGMTVNTHIRNIYRKLQVRTRAQAVRFASLRGLF